MLINHQFAFEGQPLPAVGAFMYEYIVGAQGVFIRAHRDWLDVSFLVATVHGGLLRGLDLYGGYFVLDPPVPARFIKAVFSDAWRHRDTERLYYGIYRPTGWKFVIPEQLATSSSVKPRNPFSLSGKEALIELHSHGKLPAFFSSTDNADETGFKIYTVIGKLGSARPEILTRVGIYGHFWTICSNWVYNLPTPIRDAGFEPQVSTEDEWT